MAGPAGGARLVARAEARAWLVAMREDDVDVDAPRCRGCLAIVEDMFRLPTGYFRDETIRRAADERILFARDAAARNLTVIGPCRVRGTRWTVEELHALHIQANRASSRPLTRQNCADQRRGSDEP